MIHTETLDLASEGSRSFDSYLARPEGVAGPGLLILSEMWGVAPSKTKMADDYARQGWCVLAPNLFWRSEFPGMVPFDQAEIAWKRLDAFSFDQAAADVATAAKWLRASPFCTGKIAAIGFCMGGRTAFLSAARVKVDAAIALYALGIAKHLDEMAKVSCPLQLHYGLNDEHVPRAEIDAVAAAAKTNSNVEVHLYPGAGHGFFTSGRLSYNAHAVEEANKHIGRLLARLK